MTLDLYHALKDALVDTAFAAHPGWYEEIISMKPGHRVIFKYSYENIAAQLPVKSIRELANARFVSMVDCPAGKYTTLNDVMIKQTMSIRSIWLLAAGIWFTTDPAWSSALRCSFRYLSRRFWGWERSCPHPRNGDQTNAGTPPAPYTLAALNATASCWQTVLHLRGRQSL